MPIVDPFETPAASRSAGIVDPFAEQPAPSQPSEPSLLDRGIDAFNKIAPVARNVPGPVGMVTRAAENIPLAAEAVSNAPASAAKFGSDLVQPFIHPIETAESFKNLGLGILEKTGVLGGKDHEKYADAVGHFLANRYGGIENVKRTFATDPVGLAGDLSMVLTGGGTAAARAPGMIGKLGEVARAAGTAIDPLTTAAGAVKLAGKGAAELAGVTTGAGGTALRTAAEAGLEGGQAAQAFRENMRGAAPMEQAVEDARGALDQMRKERGDAYRQAMSKTGKIGADTTVLDFNKIDNAIMKANEVQTYRGRYNSGPSQSLSPKTEAIRSEMVDAVEHWKSLDPTEFHTAEGIDALKKQLGDIRDATPYGSPERVAANKIYGAVRQTIIDQVPEYAKIMKGYEEATTLIKDIEKTLSLKPGAAIDTQLRKLQSVLRDNVNTSYGHRAELAKYLVNSGAPHLMEKLAGQALSAWAPRGLARLALTEAIPAIGGAVGFGASGAGLGALATLPTLSPRLMGEAAHAAGRLARRSAPLAPLPRAARGIGELFEAADSPYSVR